MEREIRTFTAEVRVDTSEENKPIIRGHASVFNSFSEDLGGFREIIRPGAFSSVLADSDVRALINHDSNRVLGRNKAKTLALREDENGLYNRIYPPDTTYANDLLVSMDRGDIDQQSFAFSVPADGSGERWYTDEEGRQIREINQVAKLYDVSIVTFPAYPDATASGRDVVSARALNTAKELKSAQGSGEETAASEAAQGSREILKCRIELEEATA